MHWERIGDGFIPGCRVAGVARKEGVKIGRWGFAVRSEAFEDKEVTISRVGSCRNLIDIIFEY